MKEKIKSNLIFYIDEEVVKNGRGYFIDEAIKIHQLKHAESSEDLNEENINIIFTEIKNLKKKAWPKTSLFVLDKTESLENAQHEVCDFMSYQEIDLILDAIFSKAKFAFLQHTIKESERTFEALRLTNEKKTESEYLLELDELFNLNELELQFLKLDKIQEWNECLKNEAQKSTWLDTVEILKFDQVLKSEIIFDKKILVFKLPFENYYLITKFICNNVFEISIKVESLINLILKGLQIFDQNLIRNDDEIDFWKRIFAKIPFPMAIISPLGDLIVHNELFAKIGLLPKECLSFKNQETIEFYNQFYFVKKLELELNGVKVFYYIFYTTEKLAAKKGDSKSNIDELGIVSSSIAHELNNPLAGILAALTLVALEDDWSEESILEIEEMKNGARRCKELVEIFLGFSRMSPNQKFNGSFKDSLDQAINLLKFRMVESNLRIDLKYVASLESLRCEGNSSILSMVLYLIINELLTSFAHYRLISQKNNNTMEGEVLELSNQIIFKLSENFEFEEKLIQAKLIQHLLMFEKMEMNISRKDIRLICRPNY